MFAPILTERLTLRELEAGDAQRIFQYRSHPEVSRFQSWGTQSADEIRSYIDGLSAAQANMPGSWYQIGIALRSAVELIGDCGFRTPETQPSQAELGITLAPEFQGRGYATEALRALMDYLLITLGKDRVFDSVGPSNVRSVALMQRVGMREEAHFANRLPFKGQWVDDVIFATRASDWKSAKLTP
jgi:RimJ/RimL family protein N-acetyltransferase